MKDFDVDQFMSDANAAFLYSDGTQRYGQFLMNYLYEKHPEIQVPPESDCFYDDKLVKKFLTFIYSL